MNELLKVILVKAKKEESCRENIKVREYVNNHEQNVGTILMVKVILMRYQVEMRNTLLDNGGKAILVKKWQRPWMNCS